MSAAQELMARLARLDVELQADGDQLRLNAPKGVLTPELKQELVVRKPELLALLNTATGGIEPAPAGVVIPLTSGQQRLWALMRVQQASGLYNVPMVYRLHGGLDVDALEQSLAEIQRRHAILRTAFRTVEGKPRQHVADTTTFALKITDLTSLADTEQAAAVDKELDASIQYPFDLKNAPLWRCTLLRLAPAEYVLAFTMHHIIFDRFSKTVFLRELEALYAGGKLPQLAIEYRDFAYWQQSEAQQSLADRQMDYWKAKFVGAASELLLPTDHPRPTSIMVEGRSQTFVVSAAVTEKLRTLSRTGRASMYMTLLAAFHALLHRYTGQTDQIICSPVACRNSTSVEALIGYFNNIVPMHADLSGDPVFRDLLGRVRQVTMDAIKHQDAPFQQIVKLPNLASTPLTRGMFSFRSADSSVLHLQGLAATPVENRRRQADFDLALYMGMEKGTLCGVLDYNAEIFEEETIRSLLSNFQALLEAVAADPDRPLSALPSLRPRFPEIENALVKHAKVDEAVVVVRSDAGGTSNRVAYLVLNEDDIPSREELRSVLAALLPADQQQLVFVPLDQMPTLADGAVDLAGLPAPTLSRQGNAYLAPRTALESALAEIWQRVLWRDEKIGIHDNFFDLGGHSLLSLQLLAETEKHLQRSLPLATLGQLSTIAEFVTYLERPSEAAAVTRSSALDADIRDRLRRYTAAWHGKRTSTDSLVVGLNTEGSKQPVFWCVQRYINLTEFAKHLGADQPIYGMRSAHNVIERTPENIRAMAHHYVDEILQIQSRGPFIIGGICQAAVVAFQMALRLRDLGHELNLLGLQERFIPQDYPGRVAFFFGDISTRSPYYQYVWPELGWRKYYTGGFEAHIIRGEHGTYFREENIQYLTREMQIAFERAQAPARVSADGQAAMQRLNKSAYQAQCSVVKPVAATRGEIRLVVKVKNASPCTWLASERSGVFLGARWLNPKEGGSPYTHATQARTRLPTDLKPGGTVELELVVGIPEDIQVRILEVDMVDEGITWFSNSGSERVQVEIQRR